MITQRFIFAFLVATSIATAIEALSARRIRKCQTQDFQDKYVIVPLLGNAFVKNVISLDSCVNQCDLYNKRIQAGQPKCNAVNFLSRSGWCALQNEVITVFNKVNQYKWEISYGDTYSVILNCSSSTTIAPTKPTTTFAPEITTTTEPAPPSFGCGKQSEKYQPNLSSTTTIDEEARKNSWPWIVSQQLYGYHICASTLLRVSDDLEESDVALAPAHCVFNPKKHEKFDDWQAVAGIHTRFQDSQGEIMRRVVDAQFHEQYAGAKADVAVVRFDQSVKFSDTIKPVCLPDQNEAPPVGRYCVVAGWGRKDNSKNRGPDMLADALQQSVQPVLTDDQCAQFPNYQADNMICAGAANITFDGCKGDKGGVLVCKMDDGRWVQYGMAAGYTGPNGMCQAKPGKPMAFAEVSKFADWIRSKADEMSQL